MSRLWVQTHLRTIVIAVAYAVAVLALLVGLLRGVGCIPTPIELAPQPERANTDHDIFDVVLSDIIDSGEFRPLNGGPVGEEVHILMGDRTVDTGNDHRVEAALRSLGRPVPADIRADLMRRNPRGKFYSLARYHPSNLRIVVRSMADVDGGLSFDRQFPGAVGFVLSCLPGYSSDGRIACCLFAYGPTMHGASGCYLLRKAKGRWEVVAKGFRKVPHETL